MPLIACPVAGKRKSQDLCEAFVAGADRKAEGTVFFGVDDSNMHVWNATLAQGKEYFCIDNSYFDLTRGTHFRVTRNAIQHDGNGMSDGARFRAFGLKIKPWRTEGNHIVFCPQSTDFMQRIARAPEWVATAQDWLRNNSPRPLVVREWNRDKIALSKTLEDDLRNAWALVTHSSAAAITALLNGIPAFSAMGSAAALMGNDYKKIEDPYTPTDREEFFGVLADNQFTIEEMRSGQAWEQLQIEKGLV